MKKITFWLVLWAVMLMVAPVHAANFYWKSSTTDLNAIATPTAGDRGIVITDAGVVSYWTYSGSAWVQAYATLPALGPIFSAASSKTTPVDADVIPLSNSQSSGALNSLSWTNLKATLKTYFDGVYEPDQTVAQTAEMQAGTETATRAVSPALVKAAIDNLGFKAATPGTIGGTTPAAGTFTTLSAGAGGFGVDADGDVTGKSFSSTAIDGSRRLELTNNTTAWSGCSSGVYGMSFDAGVLYICENGTKRGVISSLATIDDDAVAFDDADGLWTATTIGAALEEMNNSINAGAPNGTGAKVHWSQLLGVPAGFADGTDDGSGAVIENEAFGSGWNGDTTNGASKDNLYDWGHTFDTDDDGKVNVIDIAAGIPKTDANGVISVASPNTDYLPPSNPIETLAPTAGNGAGQVIYLVAATGGIAAGNVCYINSSGQLAKAQANAAGTMHGVCVAPSAISAAASGNCITSGVYRFSSTQSWTPGAKIYVSAATAGLLTSTAPSTSTNLVQAIGTALAADTILIQPSVDVGTVQ